MKKITQILIAALAFGLALTASAVTVTNADGTTFTVTTLAETAAAERDLSVQQDQSKIPGQDSREGYFMAVYDVDVQGGSAGAVDIGPVIPDGCAVLDGFVQVTEAFLPANATNTVSIGLLTATDLLAATTNLTIVGTYPLNVASQTYFGTTTNTVLSLKSPVIATGTADRVTTTIAGATATSGVAHVYLRLVQLQ